MGDEAHGSIPGPGPSFRAEVFLPFDARRSTAGRVEVSRGGIVVEAGGERFGLAAATVLLSLGGQNGERVVVEGEAAAGSSFAGRQVYLQCPDQGFLGSLAAIGPEALRTRAAQLARGGRAVSRRWRVALLAAAFSLVAGGALIYLTFDTLVSRAVAEVPASWENALGESLFVSMTAGRPRAPEAEDAVVKAAFERLRPHVAAPGYDFAYAVVESPEVNAFALPGGKLVVLEGLVKAAARPEEVAGVLAHEFQHAVLRHSLQKTIRAAGLQAVLSLFLGDLQGLGAVVRDAGVQVQELSYGRDQEREADLTAIDLLVRARIDPAGLPDFFDRLAAKEGTGTAGAGGKALSLLATHPASAERSAALRARIAQLGTARYEPLAVR